MGMNIATKAALTALSGVKIGGGYAVKGVGKGVGYIGFGLKWTGDKIERGGDAMAQFGSEMVDSGMLAWKIAGGQLSEEELQNIVNEAEKKDAIDAEIVDDNKAGLDNLKQAAVKAAETAMEAVAQVIETVQTKTAEEKTAPTAQTTAQKSETEMSPAEMAEAFC